MIDNLYIKENNDIWDGVLNNYLNFCWFEINWPLINILILIYSEWETVRVKLQQHPDFSQYFLESPDEQPWQESDLVDSNETRIPLDILDSSEAEACFEEHKASLETEDRRKE